MILNNVYKITIFPVLAFTPRYINKPTLISIYNQQFNKHNAYT